MFSLGNTIIVALIGAVLSGFTQIYKNMIGMLGIAIVLSVIWLIRFGLRKFKASKRATESTSHHST